VLDANIKIISELKDFISIITANPALLSRFSVCGGKHFTRNRKLPFSKLVLFIAKLCKKTLSVELEEFFKDMDCQMTYSVSAFSQQRLKLEPIFFYYWNMVLVKSFYHYYGETIQRWRGYRLIAADGSTISLINNAALNKHFGGQANQTTEFVLAKTYYHYDVLNEIIVLPHIESYRYGELNMAYDTIGLIEEDMLMIYDRNFCNYKTVALHMWQEKERKFVIRCSERRKIIKQFIDSGQSSCTVNLEPTMEAIAGLKKSGFIITRYSLLKVRLIRVELPGCVEVLMTNLWQEEGYETHLFKDIYFMRWKIETNIATQKNILQLEAFSGLTVPSILQDFYATVLMTNLNYVLIKDAQNNADTTMQHRKYPVKINRNKAFGKLKANLIDLFLREETDTILKKLHAYFIRDVLPVRKGRSFQRIRKNPQSKSKYKTFTNFKAAH